MQKKDYMIQLLKYFIMAVIVGIIVGAIDALFGRVLIAISDFRTIHYQYLLPFLPIAGLVITAMYYVFSKLSLKGMKLVFEVGQQKTDSIPLLLIPLVMIGTWLTHLFGGSAGREGVAVQIGATLSHALGRKFNFPENGRSRTQTSYKRKNTGHAHHRYGSRIRRIISDTIKCNILCDRGNRNRENGL